MDTAITYNYVKTNTYLESLKGVWSKFLGGEGGSSEGCLKWGGGGH